MITTSGSGTGIAADVAKIHTMKKAIGSHPLAIASGITPENMAKAKMAPNVYIIKLFVGSCYIRLSNDSF